MNREITQRELRNDSAKIMRELDDGATFIVTATACRWASSPPLRRYRFVAAATAVALFRGAPVIADTRLRADLDAAASQEPAPRG